MAPSKSEHCPNVEKSSVPSPVSSSMDMVPVKERPELASVQLVTLTVCVALVTDALGLIPEKTALPPPGHSQVVKVVDVQVQFSVILFRAAIALLAICTAVEPPLLLLLPHAAIANVLNRTITRYDFFIESPLVV